ncbi:MAG TPA: sulfite exporter TauE/SafE family protein [Syntrophales bacterium]|nr:sulfite exporter TauE/SafE family protein [Syntrophales bacterium]
MPEYTIATALIIFAGALLQGLAGFGGALVAMPFILLYAEPVWAAPVVVLCYTINRIPALFVLRKNLMWDHSLLLLAAAVPGAFLGTYLLKSMEPGFITKVLGTILILFSAYKILSPGTKLAFSKAWALPTGLLSGVLGGAFGTDGPPVVVYAALQPWAKEQVVGMLQSFFLFANFIIVVSYGYHGLLSPSVLDASAIAVPFAIAGIFLGLRVNRRIGQRRFQIVLSVLIGVMGFILWMR